MRIKKSYLKISLLILVLLFAIVNYLFINPHSRSSTRRRRNTDVSDKSHWAADWDSFGEFSEHFLKDPVVNQLDFKFIHASEKACLNKSVDILVAMQSSVISFDRRRLARRTWNTQQSIRLVYLFFTGKAGELDGLQNRIDNEAKRYGDLVQADIDDSTQNLSLISMSMLKWVATYCPNARFVVKKVEDNWVDFPQIFQALRQKETDYKHFIMGNSALVVQTPLQHAIHYYYKSIFEYNDSPFTLFAKEPVYGFTARTAMVLFHATLRTKLFWKEDVFITGMAAHRARVKMSLIVATKGDHFLRDALIDIKGYHLDGTNRKHTIRNVWKQFTLVGTPEVGYTSIDKFLDCSGAQGSGLSLDYVPDSGDDLPCCVSTPPGFEYVESQFGRSTGYERKVTLSPTVNPAQSADTPVVKKSPRMYQWKCNLFWASRPK